MPLGAQQPSHPSYGPLRPTPDDGHASMPPAPAKPHDAEDTQYQALLGALKLVGADGGELALLDAARKGMVVRARIKDAAHPPGYGAAARASQPLPGGASPWQGATAVAEQPTVLLPAAPSARVYQMGHGLIGAAWQRADVTVMRGDEYRRATALTAGPFAEASSHIAVPIYRDIPLSDVEPPGPPTSGDVIGVIAVFFSDPRRTVTNRDVELLRMHAMRVSSELRLVERARESQSQGGMLEMLRGAAHDLPALYRRISELVRQVIDAPSFGLALYDEATGDLGVVVAERDGAPVQPARIPASDPPAWWRAMRGGKTALLDPQHRAVHPEYAVLGWGPPAPEMSLLAAPLSTGTSMLGALVVASPRPEAYGPDESRLLETIAHAAAVVIENVQLNEARLRSESQSREKALQLAALNNAVLTLNASLDLNETLQALADQASQLTTAEYSVVFLVDDTHEQLVARASVPRGAGNTASGADGEVVVPLSWRGIGRVLTSGQFAIMDHLEVDWHDGSSVGQMLAEYSIHSCLMLPIERHNVTTETAIAPLDVAGTDQGLLGALVVFTPGQRHHFPTKEVVLLQGLASQAGAAISNAKLYQQLKEAYEHQQELDRLKSEFILTISHEFRTPLTTINGYITLIERRGNQLDQQKLDQFGGEIRVAIEQLSNMMNTLADAHRLDTHSLDTIIKPVNLHAAAKQGISTQPPDVKANIRIEIPETVWVEADYERLPTVITNLIGNAVKYAPNGKPYRVLARPATREELLARGHLSGPKDPKSRNSERVRESVARSERWVVVHVVDNGPGISRGDQELLFGKFKRLERSLTTNVRGTGLGLWICREYIEAMGGDIWVESDINLGADFQFCLPVAAPPEE